MTIQTPITVFYSWQSDLPHDTNHRAISTCIQSALLNLQDNDVNLKIKFDEATRDEPGTPDIPSTIFNKISSADIFICDITTINHIEVTKRKTPNPNVLIELGFAIATLGWERVVMVFNKNFGTFPNELPFDLDKRRVTPFTIKEKSDKNGRNDLTNKMSDAVQTIIKANPKKPAEKKARTEEEIKREKDVANLKNLISCIHIETFDNFIDALPNKILGRIFSFWYSFQSIYSSNSFHIYDYHLRSHIDKLQGSWGKTLSFDVHFSPASNGKDYNFYIPFDVFPNEKSEEDFKILTKETEKLRKLFKQLLHYIRYNYLEVDLEEMSKIAIVRYIDEEKDSLDELEK